MKNKSAKTLFALILGVGLPLPTLHAANDFFATGDLILFFQKPGDEDTVFVGLGNAANLYRGSAAGPSADRQALNIVNISSALTTAYGPEWASDPGIYAGVVACRSNSTGTSVPAIANGDQSRTLYASRARTSVGNLGSANSAAWNLVQANSSTAGATDIVTLGNNFETTTTTQVAVSPTSVSFIDNFNPFLVPGIQDTAFSAFVGGVQQVGSATPFGVFGPAGSVEFALDVNRIVPLNDSDTTGEVSGVKQIGSYEGTLVIGTDGNVSFITQGSGSAYDSWIGGFNPPLTNANDRLPSADPDNDGTTNLMEFVLNGNPGTSDNPSVAPTLNATGANFVFGFNRRDDSEAGNTLLFQYGSDLTGWTNVTIGAGNNVVGDATVAVTENTTSPDAITVTVPKPVGPGSKLFGRLKVTQP